MIDDGQLTDETARDHPQRNVLTQVLGLGEPRPETHRLPLLHGDWLILCSDGLNDELTDAEIASRLREVAGNVGVVAERLIADALAHGGRDNVSVVAVAYEGPDAESEQASGTAESRAADESRGWKRWLASPPLLGLGAALLVFLIFLYFDRGIG